MSREDPQLRIRLPLKLKNEIENSAIKNGRSTNSEIVRAIELYLNSNEDAERDNLVQRLKAEIVTELDKKFNITRK